MIETKTNTVQRVFTTWCHRVKFTISAEKTSYTLMKRNLHEDPFIRVIVQGVKRQRSARYFGVMLYKKTSMITSKYLTKYTYATTTNQPDGTSG